MMAKSEGKAERFGSNFVYFIICLGVVHFANFFFFYHYPQGFHKMIINAVINLIIWFLLVCFSECGINAMVLSPARITWEILKTPDVQATHQTNHIKTCRGGTQASLF